MPASQHDAGIPQAGKIDREGNGKLQVEDGIWLWARVNLFRLSVSSSWRTGTDRKKFGPSHHIWVRFPASPDYLATASTPTPTPTLTSASDSLLTMTASLTLWMIDDGCTSHGWIRHRGVAIQLVCYMFLKEGVGVEKTPQRWTPLRFVSSSIPPPTAAVV